MRDTCRVRSARVIRAKFLAMHFPRTWPTNVNVALSPYSAAVRHWYIITITTTVITAMASISLSLFLCHCSIYTSCGGGGGGASRFGND